MAVTLYWIVQADATATPTNVQIKDGQDGTGAAALKSGSEAYTAGGTYDEATAITGLSAGTAYEQCWVAWDGATYSNVVTTTIYTNQTPIDCSVGNAVAAGIAATISTAQTISCSVGNAVAAGIACTVPLDQTVSCSVGNAVAAGVSCTVPLDQTIACSVGNAVADGVACTISLGSDLTIDCSVGNAVAAGTTSSITTDQTIACSVGNAVADGVSATITLDTAITIDCSVGNCIANGVVALIEAISAASRDTGAGKSRKPRKRKYQVEINGEVYDVSSVSEAEQVLEKVKKEAEDTAVLAIDRAKKALRRPVRQIVKDAKKALVVPEITASPSLEGFVNQIVGQIQATYESTIRSIEIAALLRKRDREIEEDDEDILMLL
jgi:hypothetical protein